MCNLGDLYDLYTRVICRICMVYLSGICVICMIVHLDQGWGLDDLHDLYMFIGGFA